MMSNNIAPINKTLRIDGTPFGGLISAEALVAEAERRLMVRDYEGAKTAGSVLLAHGLPSAVGIGSYFVALGLFRNGKGDVEQSRLFLEAARKLAPEHYRERAMLSLATLLWHEREYSAYLKALESAATLSDPVAAIEARRAMAVFASLNGDHRQALARLESLYPLAFSSTLYLSKKRVDFLNSFAFELCKTGLIAEAREVASELREMPYLDRFPEIIDTLARVDERTLRRNVAYMPERAPTTTDLARGDAWKVHNDFVREHGHLFEAEQVQLVTGYARGLLEAAK